MSLFAIAIFTAIAGVATIVQTLTGFAFGLVMMGTIALLGLVPLKDAAVLVGLLTLVNSFQMLSQGGWRHVMRYELALTLCASLPFVAIGFVFLEWIASTQVDMLRLILGFIIMASSIQLIVKSKRLRHASPAGAYLRAGAISGFMGGMFSTGGPPLVHLFYRQPFPIATIRHTLVAAFASAQILRIGLVVASGSLPIKPMIACVLAAPVVMVTTWLVRRLNQPFPLATLQRIVFGLIFLSGLSLALPPLFSH